MNTLPIETLMTWPGWHDKVQYYRNHGHTLTSSRARAAAYFRTYYDANGNLSVNNPVEQLFQAYQPQPQGNMGFNAHQQAQMPQPVEQITDVAIDVETNTGFLDDLIVRKSPVKSTSPDVSKVPLQNIFSYPKMNYQKDKCIAYEKSVGQLQEPFEFVTNNGIIGIEVEVENITNGMNLPAYWSCHEDGSLRNNGIEFVSVPLQVKQIQYAVDLLYKELKTTNKPEFTNRTSVHIHLNCRDMTQDQVYALTLLYAIFEKHFYGFAGTRRMNSIFCVPLFRCNLLSSAVDIIYRMAPSWHKYCGINLLPLWDNNGRRGYGTVEFRHLYGTDNKHEVFEWINNILCLRKAALEIPLEEIVAEIKAMNTTSGYLNLFSRVFPNIKMRAGNKDFEECISNIKREIFGKDYQNTLNRWVDSQYWMFVRERGLKG